MVLVDTSVWVWALRPTGNSAVQARLKPFILNGEAAISEWILFGTHDRFKEDWTKRGFA